MLAWKACRAGKPTTSHLRRAFRARCDRAPQDDVYLFPKDLDEKAATFHFPALRAELAVPTQEQADYNGFNVEGPSKVGHYRY